MKLTNLQVFNLYMWLRSPLHGEELIARNKFVNMIKPQFDKFANSRIEKLKSYAELDPKTGEPLMEPSGAYKMKEENKAAWDAYTGEVVEYDLSTIGKETCSLVKRIMRDKPARDLATEEGLLWQEVYDQL